LPRKIEPQSGASLDRRRFLCRLCRGLRFRTGCSEACGIHGPEPRSHGPAGRKPGPDGLPLLRIPFGAMVDRFGGRELLLVLLGLTGLGLALITLAFLRFPQPEPGHYLLFLLCGVLSGCGIAAFSVGIHAVSYWYPQKKQGAVLALYGGLGNLAPGIFALVLP
jgi:hypothetical protein